MDLIIEAHKRLFPENEFPYQTELNYNLRLSDFNSNIRFNRTKVTINLNLQWKDIDDEIKIGLIQSLLLKMLKKKTTSPNIELYNNFVKNIPILTPKTEKHPILEASFQRVNQQFFNNQLEQPNLTWGTNSKRKLASYNFHSDTISVSTLFKEVQENVLDYLVYHECLHKWQKFQHKNGRSAFHTREFREAERKYPQQESMEQEISKIIRQKSKKFSWKDLFG
jgi:predicted metal-dependent hydrolase